jgi:hypothetical protein
MDKVQVETSEGIFKIEISPCSGYNPKEDCDDYVKLLTTSEEAHLHYGNILDLIEKDELAELEKTHKILPLYITEHGGSYLSTSRQCQWDSSRIGYLVVSNDIVVSNTDTLLEQYNCWLNGTFLCYSVEKAKTCDCCKHTEWELMDSCGSYVEMEAMIGDVVYQNFTKEEDRLKVTEALKSI